MPDKIAANIEAILLYHGCLGVMTIVCSVMAFSGGIPMPAETHGSIMYAIPAEVWGVVLMATHAAGYTAARVRAMGILSATGLIAGIAYITIAISAMASPFGLMLSLGCWAIGTGALAIWITATFERARECAVRKWG